MKLEAKTPTEKRLKEYLDANASDALREKIAALPDRFNLAAAWDYIRDEARKQLKGHSGFLEDETVFGWLVHYYEDVAPAEAAKPAKAKAKEEAKPRSARKGASNRNRPSVAAADSSKRGTSSPEPAAASDAPTAEPSPDGSRRTADGAAEPTADAAGSGFSFALFDSEGSAS